MLQREIRRLQDKVKQVMSERKALQEEVAHSKAKMHNCYEDLLTATHDFGSWADGLKLAIENQFHEVEDKLIS